MDLYIKLSVKTTNITNKLLDKPRESEWGGGGFKHTRISSTVLGLSDSSLRRGTWEGGWNIAPLFIYLFILFYLPSKYKIQYWI